MGLTIGKKKLVAEGERLGMSRSAYGTYGIMAATSFPPFSEKNWSGRRFKIFTRPVTV